MRVLHLLEQASTRTTATTLALMAQSVGRLGQVDEHVALAGPPALGALAQQCGLRGATVVGAPFGRAIGACGRLGRWADVDLVHCWSVGALTASMLRFPRQAKVLTLTGIPSKRQVHWLRMLCGELSGRVVLTPISSTIRREVLSGGVPEAAVHVVRPALDMAMVDQTSRAALRERWGVEDDSIKIAMLLGDPPTGADALAAFEIVSRVNDSFDEGRAPVRLLVHPQQNNGLAALRFARHRNSEHWLIRDPDVARPWSALPGADIALATRPGAGNLSLLWAMAANVPIVGEATYGVSEIVEDRHSALLAKPGRIHLLGHRVHQLIDDPQLAWQLRDAARHEAYSFFSRQHYCKCLTTLYEQLVIDETIDLPQMQVTGGLRFTGRA